MQGTGGTPPSLLSLINSEERCICITPNVELTGPARRAGLAVRGRINQGAARPGPCAVAGPVERRVMRSATEGTESGGPQAPMAESQLADRKRGASRSQAAEWW